MPARVKRPDRAEYKVTPIVAPDAEPTKWLVRFDAPAGSGLETSVFRVVARSPEDAASKAQRYAEQGIDDANAMGSRYKRGWPKTVIVWQPYRVEGTAL